jgi:non-heme chloroperoxidase
MKSKGGPGRLKLSPVDVVRAIVPRSIGKSAALAAISLQAGQLLWRSNTDGFARKRHAHPTARRRMMVWNAAVSQLANSSRRKLLATVLTYAASLTVRPTSVAGGETKTSTHPTQRIDPMNFATTKDGVQIFYKDWGPKSAQPIVFHHGWPLSSGDWDTQMLFFVGNGYRVVAHDRRGHGRSSQVSDGHDMERYAADAAAVAEHLDLRNAIHIGHSTGGGEATRYVARYGRDRVAKLVLISAVPPLMLKTDANPGGLPIAVFDDLRKQLAANRSQFYLDFASGPFYGYNRPGTKGSQAVIWNWWRQGMMGGAKAHYDGIKAFSETDQTEDLKSIDVPTLVMHGDDDQIVPYKDAALLSVKLLKYGTLKIYPAFPHGMPTTHADVINRDILEFARN